MIDKEDALQIEGRNAVAEALRAGKAIDRLFVLENAPQLAGLAAKAAAAGAVVTCASRQRLDVMSQSGGTHQGIIAVAAACEYVSVDEILEAAAQRGEKPFVVLCDHVEDPQNLGAIIRSAEVAGAHGVLIPKRRGAGITAAVVKSSSGAVLHMKIARVPNLAFAVEDLKKAGLWVYGADADGETPFYKADFTGATALVIGAEGAGLSRLIKEKCDVLVSIPVRGQTASLNASAAAAVLLFEAVRQRVGG